MSECLEQAIADLDAEGAIKNSKVKNTLRIRLQLRRHILGAVECDSMLTESGAAHHWARCSALLPDVLQSHSEGAPHPQAFSAKIQRRLASSVPPRPIVSISFENAYAQLSQICQNGSEVYQVLNYQGSHNLLVWLIHSLLRIANILNGRTLFGPSNQESLSHLYTFVAYSKPLFSMI